MNKIVGDELLMQDLTTVDTINYLKNYKIVFLYFSASYCPPCVKFTPILSDVYKKLKEMNKSIEIIFISSDKTIESSNRYFNYMPWISIPYTNRNIKQRLCNTFEIKTIPHLIVMDNLGNVLNDNARYFIQNNKDNLENIINEFNL